MTPASASIDRAASHELPVRHLRRLGACHRRGHEHRLRLPLPRPADREGKGQKSLGGHPASLPGRGLRAAPGHRDGPRRRQMGDAGLHRFDREQLGAGRGLWFMGPVGTGKTTLAMLVSKAALEAGRSVAIYSLPRLLNEIRDIHRAERSHIDLLDRLTAVDLLHVDDVGAENAPTSGCWSSSTRSSTRATRSSARS